MKITTFRLALITTVIAFTTILLMDFLILGFTETTKIQLAKILQPITNLSITLVIFPIITVPIIGDIVLKSKEMGVDVNDKLLRDYVNGCFTVFLLALMELIIAIMYSIVQQTEIIAKIVGYTLLSIFVSLLLVLVILLLSLWKVINYIYEILTTTKKDCP